MKPSLPRGHRSVVIGAAGAIGGAICDAYAACGATVAALDLDFDGARRVVSRLPGEGHSARRVDVTDLGDTSHVAESVYADGRVDSIVYSAGITTTCDVIDTDWDVYHSVIAVNLHGAMYAAEAFGRMMVAEARGGSIAFISSTAGKRSEPGGAAYCASKAALIAITECFAAEVGQHGIRVNALCPGNVESPMLRAVATAEAGREGVEVAQVLEAYQRTAAERRLVDPKEVAQVAVWLASPEASGVNGESINVDAGMLTG
jgi:NAD(P)-dependent dehydrogenase (short-subunit alcohol dehydrogenase family)